MATDSPGSLQTAGEAPPDRHQVHHRENNSSSLRPGGAPRRADALRRPADRPQAPRPGQPCSHCPESVPVGQGQRQHCPAVCRCTRPWPAEAVAAAAGALSPVAGHGVPRAGELSRLVPGIRGAVQSARHCRHQTAAVPCPRAGDETQACAAIPDTGHVGALMSGKRIAVLMVQPQFEPCAPDRRRPQPDRSFARLQKLLPRDYRGRCYEGPSGRVQGMYP